VEPHTLLGKMTNRLPVITTLTANSSGWGFFLCAQKRVRSSPTGEVSISLMLQDRTGFMRARIYRDVERYQEEFEAGEFVKVQGHAELQQGTLQLVVDQIRRVNPEQDAAAGFREQDCVPSAKRPVGEMWDELQRLIGAMENQYLRALLRQVTSERKTAFESWPAAQIVHHAYRGGFLEHILSVSHAAMALAHHYGADPDVILTGAVLHDIGKLQELDYDVVTRYSREGNMIGHIALGVVMVREATAAIPDFPLPLRTHIEHLIVSHHGSREFGSPVEPMTIEAFILSSADDLDAKIDQIRRALAVSDGEGEFTAYQPRLGRVLWKGQDDR
jgi:3'-5' exoribonuclease